MPNAHARYQPPPIRSAVRFFAGIAHARRNPASVEAIRKSLTLLGQRMDWQTAPHRLEEMNAMIEAGDLWSDPARAQKLMRERQALSDAIEACLP